MKKLMILFVIVFAAALVFAGCVTNNNEMKDEDETMTDETSDAEIMDDEDDMTDDSMEDGNHEVMDEATEEPEEDLGSNPLDVIMMDIEGNEWNLAELGEKAVIKVWASWCPICLSGMEEYNTLSRDYQDGLVLTVVTPDMYGEQSKEDFIEWYKGLEGYEDIIVILDEDGLLVETAGIRGFPTFVYLNSNGRIDSTAVGHQTNLAVEAKLRRVD